MLYAKGVGDASLGLLPQGGYPGIPDQMPLVPDPQRGSAGPPFKETYPANGRRFRNHFVVQNGNRRPTWGSRMKRQPQAGIHNAFGVGHMGQIMMICEDTA